MVDIVRRLGGKPKIVKQERGKITEPDQIKRILDESNAKAVAIVHAETSTSVLQPLRKIGAREEIRCLIYSQRGRTKDRHLLH